MDFHTSNGCLRQVIRRIAVLRPLTGLKPLREVPVNEWAAIVHRFPVLRLALDHNSHPVVGGLE